MKKIILIIVILIVGISVIYAQKSISNQQANKKSNSLPRESENLNGKEIKSGTVLLKFKEGISLEKQNRVLEKLNNADIEYLPEIGIYIITSKSESAKSLIDTLSGQPEIQYVEPSYKGHINKLPDDGGFFNQWSLRNGGQIVQDIPDFPNQLGNPGVDIKAPAAWNITTGNTLQVVGVIDTGISYSNSDLSGNMWAAPSPYTINVGGRVFDCGSGTHGINLINNNCEPLDDHSHGTHVAGIIGAKGNNSEGIAGVNWTTKILAMKAFDENGVGFTDDFIRCIQYVIQLKTIFGSEANIRILNNSYSEPNFSQSFLDAINSANSNNILFVVSAGNAIPGQNPTNNDIIPQYPANYSAPNIISVAAVNNTGALAIFSNYGANTVHLAAPGQSIYSTLPFDSFGYKSGTSQAAPLVAGSAALILSKCNLDTQNLKSIILNNVDPWVSLSGKTITGGRLNVYRALQSCAPEPIGDGYNASIIYPPGQPPPAFSNAMAWDLNDSGQVVGFIVENTYQNSRLFTYNTFRGMEILSPLISTLSYQPRSINNSGWTTGGDANMQYQGFFYTQEGGFQLFNALSGYTNFNGNAINDAGIIVGQVGVASTTIGRPFVRFPNGQTSIIQPQGELEGSAIDLDNSGVALVWNNVSGTTEYFLYNTMSGAVRNFPLVNGYNPLIPLGMNNNGLVIGKTSPTGGGSQVGFFYHPTTGTQIIASPLGGVNFIDVNDQGQTIGYIDQLPQPRRFFVYDAANGFQFIDTVNGYGIQSAYVNFEAINNKGQILARGPVGGNADGSMIFLPSHITPPGANVPIYTGSVAISYSNVTGAGQTVVGPIPFPPASTLPANYLLTGSSLAYNIETTATYSGSNRVCFTLTSISDEATFNRMKLLHFENGSFVDRTVSSDFSTLEICADVTSFSPFVTALAPLGPTAANVEISGRVLSSDKNGINKARVQLVSEDNSVTAVTNPFGYFRFENVQVGRTYIIQVNHKRYRFSPQVLNIFEEISSLELTALEEN